ncbi:vWA domain-containing protein [Desulforamulus hydrothermalis]|uniref:von Willebrand factor, type A n=1 Tax=Desulforamulus hydrothermalis Lam5 = DSM 18033 TaxID=1121428 RepID=K8DXJ3_9FIRM|nr:vWA domain-containing protein [Desulforamulus hydrothermalis]CCO07362.1 von Willebrand factor, type A [Desulforamulus hydrothermalis Lam5 = DSM 18033]SHG94902.1 von Willebrand factor type A domain-containing protein [Desulforamulus hydrothermalis Lam5 = DSM 18033]
MSTADQSAITAWQNKSLSDFWLSGRGLDHNSKTQGQPYALFSHKLLASEDTDAQAMALTAILGAVARVVDIVHGRNKFTVNFSSQETRTDFAAKQIALSAEPLFNPPRGYLLPDIVDVLTGMALHEAAHAQFSSPEYYTEMPGNPFMAVIRNVVEDTYVEHLTGLYYPGYAGYFWKYRRYEFDLQPEKWAHQPKQNLMENELNLRATEFLLVMRSTKNYVAKVGRVNQVAAMLQKMIFIDNPERLRKLNTRSVARKIYEELFGNLIQHDIAYSLPSSLLDYNKRGKHQGEPGTANNNNKTNIPSQLQNLIQNMRQEQLQVANLSELMEAGLDPDYPPPPPPMVVFRRPLTDEAAAARYEQARSVVKPFVIRLRNRLSWANTRQVINRYHLPSGELDQDALYQARFSNKIFHRTEIIDTRTRKLDIGLLVDTSASMVYPAGEGLSRMQLARNLAALFVEALEPLDSVQTWVFGFNLKGAVNMYELYTPASTNKSRIGMTGAEGTTPEGTALKYAALRLMAEGRPLVQKVLIVIADGNPNPGPETRMVKEQVKRLKNLGCQTINILLGDRPRVYGYDHVIPWTDYYTVTTDFGRLLKKLVEDNR